MFDDIAVIKDSNRKSNYSFVGIQKNKENNQTELWLPHGFEDFPDNDFDAKKKFFFRMYRVFNRFANDYIRQQENIKKADRDGVLIGAKGVSIEGEGGEDVILYSKLIMLDSIIDSYDELKIHAILNKDRKKETIDYSKIDKYLDKAIYLKNGSFFLENMHSSTKVLEYTSTDLVKMYCFIYKDIAINLENNHSITDNLNTLAIQFQEEHLSASYSLFDKDTWQETTTILKDVLGHIERTVSYKDEDFWHFFDAVETFLYGTRFHSDENTQEFWGINNFNMVWEAMCQTYMFECLGKELPNYILYADTLVYANKSVGGHRIYLQPKFENPFTICLNGKDTRYMRPDCLRWENYKTFDDCIKMEAKEFIHINKLHHTHFEVTLENIEVLSEEGKECFNALISELKAKCSRINEIKKKSRTPNIVLRTRLEIKKKDFYDIKEKFNKKIEKENSFLLLDFKYMPLSSYLEGSHQTYKRKTDIQKQLIYEYALYLKYKKNVKSNFCIPYYYGHENDIGNEATEKFSKQMIESKILVFKANFEFVQNIYINVNK